MSVRTARLAVALAVGAAAAAACSSGEAEGTDREEQTDPSQPGGRAGGGSGAGGSTGRGALAPGYRPADINHVLGTGQSLSLGMMGSPPLSTEQPFGNVMFDTGLTPSEAPPGSLVALRETSIALDAPVETPSSGMANLVAMLARDVYGAPHDVLVSLHGVSGASYPMLMKSTEPYARGLGQVAAAKAIAEQNGKSYVVRAITVVHGESDGWRNWNTEYDRALVAWQGDYEADIKAITGQDAPVPMLHSQYSGWTPVETAPFNVIPIAQLRAHESAPGKVVLVGPKYFLPYADDGFHLTNEGYQRLGEYYAKAYVRHVLEDAAWEPLRPKEITREGRVVTLRLHVPVPPLVLDTERVTDPGNFGFEVHDDGLPPVSIEAVAVTAPDTVTITLSGTPLGSAKRLRYAFTGIPGKRSGPLEGARGNLRDSDETRSRSGHPLYNWCVHFDEPLP